jgi:hypothetical protein
MHLDEKYTRYLRENASLRNGIELLRVLKGTNEYYSHEKEGDTLG